MGIIVHDTIAVPGLGLSLANIYMTIKGKIEVAKMARVAVVADPEHPEEITYEPTKYQLRSFLNWYVNAQANQEGISPLYTEYVQVELTEELLNQTLDLFGYIYAQVKSRYQSTEDA
jgi:hypothetical protein